MRTMFVIAAALAATALQGVSAQQFYHWPASPVAAESAQRSYFPMGTPMTFRTRTEVNTKQARPGDRFYLEVAESLTYRGQVVVPVGAPAVGEVIRSEKNGHFGKKGKLEVRLLYVETPYGPVRLGGQSGDRGKEAAGWVIPGAALVAWPLVFVHGASAYLRHGTQMTGYTAEPLAFAQVPGAAALATVQPDSLPTAFTPR